MTQSRPPLDRHAPRNQFDGILVIDKPIDWTSHDVVAKIRNHFRLSKTGHAGTLDPVATGVLVLLVGRATKVAESLLCDEKEYRFVVRFGLVTDTHDRTGKVITDNPSPTPCSVQDIERVLDQFRGEIKQVPPMFSAVKVDGHRLYKLGRKGLEIEREARTITIRELVLENIDWPRATLRAVCSKGTYVRSLCYDIGTALGLGGCMDSLERLRSGAYSITDASTIEDVLKLSPEEFRKKLRPMPGAPSPRRSMLADLHT